MNTVSGFSDIKVIQLKPDGQLDEGFGLNGITGIDLGQSEHAYVMILQPDGKIVVGGDIYYDKTDKYDFAVARLLPNGKHDNSFSGDGILTFDMGGSSEIVYGIAIQRDGKIVLTGFYGETVFQQDIAVVRINEDGTFDSNFDLDGKKIFLIPGSEFARDVLIDAEGNIILGASTFTSETRSQDFLIMKLTPDGQLDPRFDGDGKAYVDFFAGDDFLQSMKFQLDGKIILGGSSSREGDSYAVARITNVSDVASSDLVATYIGPKILGTPCYGCQTAIIPLRAVVSANVFGGPTDPHTADVRNARVKFVDRDNNVDITGWIPVTKLIEANDTQTGTVDATWYVTLSYNQPVKKVRVGMIVDNGSYIRNDSRDDATITLYMPQDDVVSGGGSFFSRTSKGKYKSMAGTVTIYGFYAQLKKGMPQPSGHMNMWFSGTNQTGRTVTYHLEISSINGLGVNNSQALPKHAEFHGTGKLWERSGATPVLVEDNVTVQTLLVDGGNIPENDSLIVNIWSNNNVLLHSSNWSYTKPTPQALNPTPRNTVFSAEVTVHSGSSLDENPSALMTKSLIENQKEKINQKGFAVTVLNNPTPTEFSVRVSGSEANVYSIRVTDVSGRIIELRNNVPRSHTLQIGSNYRKGMYFAEIREGKNVRIVKLVKN